MVARTDVFTRLGKIALAIADVSALDIVCTSLETGRIDRGSTAAMRAAIAEGNAVVEENLRSLQEAWMHAGADLSGQALATVLRTSAASIATFRRQITTTQVVWSGPRVEGSFLRATREVIREILSGAQVELLVVGYWIAARGNGEGIIEEVIASLADAVTRGVTVSVVVDERVRPDGRDNRCILVSAWPKNVSLPKILTWRLPSDDHHIKMHAKVLVADRYDALVTSANLTSYAMDINMEMGVRLVGRSAVDIAKHFDLLAANGVVELYPEKQEQQ